VVDASAASDMEVLKELQMKVVAEDLGRVEDWEVGWEGHRVPGEYGMAEVDSH
jgi:hypothetical protein